MRRKHPDPQRRHDDGYTLLELLVVLAILGLLTGIATPMVMGHLQQARIDTAKVNITRLTSELELFKLNMGRYPTSEEGLGALVERPRGSERWNGPYVKSSTALTDPWGHPYVYRSRDDRDDFELYSAGPKNGQPIGQVGTNAAR